MKEGLIDRIYECAFVPEQWPATLDSISRHAGMGAAGMYAINGASVNWTSTEAMFPWLKAFFERGLALQSPFIDRLVQAHSDGFFSATGLASREEMAGDPMFRDMLWPAGFGEGAGTVIHAPTGDTLVLFVLNEARQPLPGRRSISRLDALRPHLARSMLTSARLELVRARVAAETLDLLGLPALVFDQCGKVFAANASIEALTELIHWRAADRIALADPAANAIWQGAVAALDRDGDSSTRSFAIRNAQGQPAMIGHVIPIRRAARDIFARSTGVLMLTPLTMSRAPPIDLVQSLFDLTPAEARVARNLTSGQSIEKIAGDSGVSLNTLRTQVRGVLEKTGCKRQAEVVSLLGGTVLPRHSE